MNGSTSSLGAGAYQGLPATLMATLNDPQSPLHHGCLAIRRAGGRLLEAAQGTGRIRPDVAPMDLFALANTLS
ncbi:hypothetical protein [Streptomyces orinoci]|uniref:Transcriptional regulator SbtR-like C-terminal domain-containing protein n=1 Tax=Streptomyces orinoci TaxID=67339 RepID=A0ABV3JZI8_STRON|nr:hypothetical protein [Streptomyces orinoci]